jgi:hypothetical protein
VRVAVPAAHVIPEHTFMSPIVDSRHKLVSLTSAVDPDPYPKDPYVFGPSGSASRTVSPKYGSGPFCHQTKIVRKILIVL